MPGRILAHVITDTEEKKRKALGVIRAIWTGRTRDTW
jgi:hypothetical protein